ncbi:MAG: hypothetical protein Q9195_006189 [Heterodermia aff. obscurata]
MSEHANELCVLVVGHFLGELSSVSILSIAHTPKDEENPFNAPLVHQRLFGNRQNDANCAQHVLQALFLSGRLNFSALIRQTLFTPRQLEHSLAVLIQENLVLWYTSAEDGSTSYEPNHNACYLLVRAGKYLSYVEDRFQEPAVELLMHMIAHGHSSVGALVQAHRSSHSAPTHKSALSNGLKSKEVNGRHVDDTQLAHALHDSLADLLGTGLLGLAHESDFRPFADNRIEAEMLAPHRDGLSLKMKQAEALLYEEGIADRLHEWKHGTEAQQAELSDLKGSKKRKISSFSEAVKKRPRLSTESNITDGNRLREDVILRINHDKFSILDRNKKLVNLAEASIGTVTSQVYAAALRMLEDQLELKRRTLFSDDVNAVDDGPLPRELPQFSTSDLSTEITFSADSNLKGVCFPSPADLADSLGHADDQEIDLTAYDHRKKRRKKMVKPDTDDDSDHVKVDGFASPDEDESTDDIGDGNVSNVESDPEDQIASEDYHPSQPNPRKRRISHSSDPPKPLPNPLTQHLLLLAHHPYQFLHHLPATLSADEAWSVDIHALSKHLLIHSLTRTVTAKFGPLAARLVRILQQKGKVDEKTLTTLSLMNQKTMRKLLSELSSEGFIELQEVPKDTQRAPMKTMFFWFFDEERCRKRVLDVTYKTMCRLLQRITVERAKVKDTVEKSERVDVRGREDEFLGAGEKEALGGWRAREERLLGELGRLDDLVAVLRDF